MTNVTGAGGDTAAGPRPMPVFAVKARDALAPETLRAYHQLCVDHGLIRQAAEVELALEEILQWQQDNPDRVHIPDHKHVPAGQAKPEPGNTDAQAPSPTSATTARPQPRKRTPMADRPSSYVYVASSWRNPIYPGIIAALITAGIEHYDFRNPPGGAGFGWEQIGGRPFSRAEPADTYLQMIQHPRAVEGFAADFDALKEADTVVLVLPCGKSAHLELGWAVGAGKRTAVLLEDPIEPELMYRMVDYLAPSLVDLLAWLGVED